MYNNGWHNGNDWISMGLMMLLFWGVVVAAIVAFVYFLRRQSDGVVHHGPAQGPGQSSARRLLDERFARGDIDQAEYVQRSDLLNR
jgi:putative membrane protein